METPNDIREKVTQIGFTALFLKTIKNKESELFHQLNQLSKQNQPKLREIQARFEKETGPVNQLRAFVASVLLKKKTIDRNSIEEKKLQIQNQFGRDVFRAYKNPFTIFFPFFIDLAQREEKEVLNWITSNIALGLNITKDQYNVKKITFEGARNLGEDRLWMAIFNKKHEKQQTAKQFFLEINFAGINISFYDRPKETHIESRFIAIGDLDINTIIQFFERHKEAFFLDGQNAATESTDATLDFNPSEGRVYKISHRASVISDESYSDMLKKNVVVVHMDAPPTAAYLNSQFSNFENAAIGDIFYLCRSNEKIELLGQFIGPLEENDVVGLEPDWKQRRYRVLKKAINNLGYGGSEQQGWLPNFNSTFIRIPEDEYSLANQEIIDPFFNTTLEVIIEGLFTRGLRAGRFSIMDNDVEPILDARLIADRFAELILTLKDNTGQMLGVFGSWGRGKTYFVNQLCKSLLIDFKTQREEQKSSFYFLKFHAWKYQDTESVWAYLYEQIAQKFYTHKDQESWKYPIKNRLLNWFYQNVRYPIKRAKNELGLRFRLNIIRKGNKELLVFGFSIIFAVMAWFIKTCYPDLMNRIEDGFQWGILFGVVSVNVFLLLRFYVHMRKIGSKGKRIVKEYTQRPTFNRLLGVQAEIQQELIFLLKAWMPAEFINEQKDGGIPNWKEQLKSDQRRLLIFIDDIDRCSEDRLIQVMDALRVMLEDEQIAKRVIVITAVDENILERAIALKYKEIQALACHDCADVKIEGRPMKELVRDYMDKLFIGGLKLASLKSTERADIIENYAEQAGVLEKKKQSEQLFPEPNGNDDEILKTVDEAPKPEEIAIGRPDDLDSVNDEEEGYYLISSQEMKWLRDQVMANENYTPRQLRVYLFRYLFAKSLAMSYANLEELDEQWCRFMIDAIDELSKDQDYKLKQDELNNLPSTPQNLKEFTPKLLQMVVPY